MFASTGSAGPLALHPRGEKLPTNQQGPFVTTGDGGVLCIDRTQAHHSLDEGRTWSSVPLFKDPARFQTSDERVLLRTRNGTIISAWMNSKEMTHPPGFKWGGSTEEYNEWILPTYVCRSLDDGQTWEEPMLLHRPWCGCIHSIIQMRSGRIVLVGQTIIPEWRHATVMYVSDDDGKTWQTSNILDYGQGKHDHAGSCEATILERADGSLYLLLRTESGFFYEAESLDGLKWVNLQKSKVPSVTCCGQMYRLSDGSAALLWNHPLRSQPEDGESREELSIAFSRDDGHTWTDRSVIGTRYRRTGDGYPELRLAYPYLYERRPGELWITTMQGGLRMKIRQEEIAAAEMTMPESILFLGDSTTAYRPGAVKLVLSDLVDRELMNIKSPLIVLNRGVGGNTSSDGLTRLKKQIGLSNAKLVVVQFGINDASIDVWKKPAATGPRVSVDKFEANLREIVELCRAHDAAVILMTTNPIRWTPKVKELYGHPPYDVNSEEGFEKPSLTQYNIAVRRIAKDLDVPLVDVHEAWLQSAQRKNVSIDSQLLDGVHPTDAGQAVTAEALLPVLRSTLKLD